MNINDILAKNPDDWSAEELLFAGSCYLRGDGVAVDEKKCFEYVKKSADLNNKTAKAFLGELYLRGCGCAPEYKMAFELCLETARIGNANSMLNIGYMYMTGTGVCKDFEKAKLWLSRSIARSEDCRESGQKLLDQILAIQAEERKNRLFFQPAPSVHKIAEQQQKMITDALLELVKDDYFVDGEKKDYLGNDPKSQYCLSVILRRESFAENLEKAYELLVKSAKGGYADAYVALAGIVCHYTMTFVEYDKGNRFKTIAEYVQKAAELESPRGLYLYSRMLGIGYYFKEDKQMSLYYLYLSNLKNDIDGVTLWYYTPELDKKIAIEVHTQKEIELVFQRSTPEEMYKLAETYMNVGDEHNYEMARIYFEEAYNRGYKPALYKLPFCCACLRDYESAKKYHILCAKDGDAEAQYEIGYFLKNMMSPQTAIIKLSIGDVREGTWEEWLSLACAQDHVTALIEYADGIEATDRQKAAECLERAYNLGNQQSLMRLGMLYFKVHDYLNAARWFEKEKEKDPNCAYYLGCICELQKNFPMAVIYFEKTRDMASDSLRDMAIKKLDTLYENKCMYCGAYFKLITKRGLFGTKTICDACGKRTR